MIAGLVHFAREAGCTLVGEGVETEAERRVLLELGVTYGQGFLFARPAPAEAFSSQRLPPADDEPRAPATA